MSGPGLTVGSPRQRPEGSTAHPHRCRRRRRPARRPAAVHPAADHPVRSDGEEGNAAGARLQLREDRGVGSAGQAGAADAPVRLGRHAAAFSRLSRPASATADFGGEGRPGEGGRVRATGFLFCQNARFTKNTTAGWSHVRAIRVLAGKGLTTRSSHSYIVHAGSEVTELGTVPLAPDGSFAVEVPADTAIAFQAVDAEGRSELNEMSWIYVRPGEQRGCLGCHQPRQAAPRCRTRMAQALRARPLKLLGQGQPHRFRGNNAAVTGMMELQFDRYREVAGINRHSETVDPLATGAQEVERSGRTAARRRRRPANLGGPAAGDLPRPRRGARTGRTPARRPAARCGWLPPWRWPPVARASPCRRCWRR